MASCKQPRSPSLLAFVIPGDINTRTGGYRYDKKIVEGLKTHHWQVELISLCGDYPFPTDSQLKKASQAFENIPTGTLTVVDGLAFGSMPGVLEKHSDRLHLIALVHHPLALETGLNSTQAAMLKSSEIAALKFARHIITTSQLTAESLEDYQVHSHRVTAIAPGTDKAPLAAHKDAPPWRLLCVATITARKGHEILLHALAQLNQQQWHLTCVGSTQRDTQTYQALQRTIRSLRLESKIIFAGEVGDAALERYYQQADLMVLASWHEGYGMVLDEAIARGLPIVCTSGGAMDQTVPEGAGIIVAPGNVDEFCSALALFMQNGSTRQNLRSAAQDARNRQRSWPVAIDEFCALLDKLQAHETT